MTIPGELAAGFALLPFIALAIRQLAARGPGSWRFAGRNVASKLTIVSRPETLGRPGTSQDRGNPRDRAILEGSQVGERKGPENETGLQLLMQARVLSVDMEKHRIGLSLDKKHEGEESARPEVNVADYVKPKWSPGTLGDLLKESRKKQK